MGRAAGKKRKLGAVTHDEVSGYTQTETLFKSNLFKLQTDELLREVAPFKAPLTRLEKALRELRTQLLALPAADVWWQRQKSGSPTASHPHLAHLALANESVHMTWHAPTKVDLVGSYLLRTVTAPELNVDVAVELPASMFLEKDYLDQRYADKRLLYLTHLAHLLSTAAASVVSASSPPRFIALPHMQAHNWPRCNLRCLGARPSAAYNNLVRLESQYARVLGLLHSTFSRDASGALRDAAVLLRVWLRQRDARQNGCLSGFQITLLMVHLLHTRALSYSMGSSLATCSSATSVSQAPIYAPA
ncbi:nucleolar protein 6 [Chrysochromulina tobinii]|uniref:Nucleolar protein 6 n=1 Tax=Chrysochromulina tobinii TaxID=1460289 RepID=A0A0M0JU12_9EUKA|nr:nucleolar protein 6 [Chrysochromulina tobinii]|eukprot:KOO30039.1 nucleolar protein 6 [Chrysochromulina sp. CCMP291]